VVADLIQARVAYGPMRSADDKSWGSLAAWELASRSIVISVNNLSMGTATRIANESRRPLRMTEEQERIVGRRLIDEPQVPINCEGVQRDRSFRNKGSDIVYPPGAASDYAIAGVIIRVDITDQGLVTNARLLGAVPTGPFSDNAMQAVQTWKYTIPSNVSPICLKDRDVSVSFAIG
jgi:TonB family protein